MNDVINAPAAPAIEQAAPQAVNEQAAPIAEQAEIQPTEQTPESVDDAPFPKKAVNAISRRDKQIAKLRGQIQELQARVQAPQPSQQKQLNEADFESYGDYLKADITQKAKQDLIKEFEQQKIAEKQTELVREQMAHHEAKSAEYAKTIPDYQHVFMESADVIDALPEHVAQAFLEADDAPLAFYALAKEGNLEALANLSPHRAAIEIGKAELRGAEMIKARKVTQAPAPMKPNKGTATGTKSIGRMTPEELAKHFKF